MIRQIFLAWNYKVIFFVIFTVICKKFFRADTETIKTFQCWKKLQSFFFFSIKNHERNKYFPQSASKNFQKVR